MTRLRWQPWQEQMLREHYRDSLTVDLARVLGIPLHKVLAKANRMGLRKSAETIAETSRERSLRPDHGGKATRFQPGLVPFNKGVKGITGHQPGCRAHQFKPGQMPSTWRPIGTEVVNSDGYLDRKVSEQPGARHLRWKPVHRLVWEAAHGPVPDGHIVVFKAVRHTTDVTKITLDAIELISRRELIARNTVHRYGPEIASIAQLRGAIRRRINNLAREEQSHE